MGTWRIKNGYMENEDMGKRGMGTWRMRNRYMENEDMGD